MPEIIHYSVRIAELDKRARTLVILARSDRQMNQPYYCHRCTFKVGELVNHEVVGTSDVFNMEETPAVGLRCDGKYYDDSLGKMVNCRHWYYFMVN